MADAITQALSDAAAAPLPDPSVAEATTSSDVSAILTLGRMLVNIALVQVLGFISKSTGLMPAATEAGIGAYLGRIALPSLLFGALAVCRHHSN